MHGTYFDNLITKLGKTWFVHAGKMGIEAFAGAFRKEAKTIAEAITPAAAAAAPRLAQFMQISPTRYNIPGLAGMGREQIVKDRQTHTKLDTLIGLYRDAGAVFE